MSPEARTPVEDTDPPQDVGPGDTARPGLPMLVAVAISLAAIGLSLALLQSISGIIAPIFLAVNLMVVAYPLFVWLVASRVPRGIAAVITGVAVFTVILLGAAMLVWSITAMIGALSEYSERFVELFDRGVSLLGSFGIDNVSFTESLDSISPESLLGLAGGLISNASGAAGIILIILVAMVFMIVDLTMLTKRTTLTHRLHPEFTDAISSFVAGIRRYWVVTTVFGLVVAVLDGIVLVALGVSLPLVWAVLSFVTNYIPNVGFFLGLVPPALLAYFEQGPVTATFVIAAYGVINVVFQAFIQPKVAGDAVGVTGTISFISLLLWAWVFGPLGALIALPSTLAVKALLIDPDPRMRWVNAFISNDPVGDVDVHPEETRSEHSD